MEVAAPRYPFADTTVGSACSKVCAATAASSLLSLSRLTFFHRMLAHSAKQVRCEEITIEQRFDELADDPFDGDTRVDDEPVAGGECHRSSRRSRSKISDGMCRRPAVIARTRAANGGDRQRDHTAIHRRLTELPMSPPKQPVCESYGQTDEPGRPHVRNGPFARLPTCDAGAVKSDSG